MEERKNKMSDLNKKAKRIVLPKAVYRYNRNAYGRDTPAIAYMADGFFPDVFSQEGYISPTVAEGSRYRLIQNTWKMLK